jgi:hypothetical protein
VSIVIRGILVFAVLAFLTTSVQAFRGVELESPCKLVEEIEIRHGSDRDRAHSSNDGTEGIFFKGTHLGRDALISYMCEKQAVRFQLVTVKFSQEHDARLAFSDFQKQW